jgi:hypothetical protein
MARRRSDDMPARVECANGRYYYVPGALGRNAGEPQRSIALGKDREAARQRATEYNDILAAGMTILAPIQPTLEHLRQLVYRTRQRAKDGAMPHDLDLAYLDGMMIQQGRLCALTGIPFSLGKGKYRSGPWAPSVDRLDCAGGYTRGNVRLVCHAVNVALNEWGDGVLQRIADALRERDFPKDSLRA